MSQSQYYKQRNQAIIHHLKCTKSNYGEVFINDLYVPQHHNIEACDDIFVKTVQQSLLQFHGNIFPVIVKNYSKQDFAYEVIYGSEFVNITKELIKEIGSEKAHELNITKLRVWLINDNSLDTHQIIAIQEHIEKLLNYHPKRNASMSVQSRNIIVQDRIYQELETLYANNKPQELLNIVQSSLADISTINKFIKSHSQLRYKALKLNIQLSPNLTKDQLLPIFVSNTDASS